MALLMANHVVIHHRLDGDGNKRGHWPSQAAPAPYSMATHLADLRALFDEYEIVEDAGHLPCIEQPKATATLTGDFARQVFARTADR